MTEKAVSYTGTVPDPDEDLTVAGVIAKMTPEQKAAPVKTASIEPQKPAPPEKVERSVK